MASINPINNIIPVADLTISSGNLNLPTTTASVGYININNRRTLHQAGAGTNIFCGDFSGNTTITGFNNAGFGNNTLQALTNSQGNTACGSGALFAVTSGSFNIGIGNIAAFQLITGSGNVCVGYQAGSQYTSSESSNICIGYNVNGTTGESNITRIGSGQSKAFISGIRGITTANADAIAVLVDSAGQLGTVSSSIRFKENVHDLEHTHVLELRPVAFNYKQDGRVGIGLIAEEVEKVMPSLVAYDEHGECHSVKYHDLPVLLLLEIQKLRKELDELKKK